MPFLNFGGNKNKHYNLSGMNFFMKNMKNRYSDSDPLWNRILYYRKVDPDPLFPNVDPRIRIRIRIRIHVKMSWIRNADKNINKFSFSWLDKRGIVFSNAARVGRIFWIRKKNISTQKKASQISACEALK